MVKKTQMSGVIPTEIASALIWKNQIFLGYFKNYKKASVAKAKQEKVCTTLDRLFQCQIFQILLDHSEKI